MNPLFACFGVNNMGRRDIEEKLFRDLEPLVSGKGSELLDVELVSENRMSVLRVTIYKPEGITLDDCAGVQRVLSDRLDETDPVPGSYNLEVSSPGLERTLRRDKEFGIFRGKPCQVNLFAPFEGKRVFEGELVGLESGESGKGFVVLETPDGTVRLDRSIVSRVKLVYRTDRDPRGRDPSGRHLADLDM